MNPAPDEATFDLDRYLDRIEKEDREDEDDDDDE